MHEEMLEAALTGGKSDGRLLLSEIAGLLREGYDENLTHGLLPKEFVLYLSKAISVMLESPRQTGINLKISKPANNPGEDMDLTRDGIITYMCINAIERERKTNPKAGMNKVFIDITSKIYENSDFQLLRGKKNKISDNSEKSIERIYKRTIPIYNNFNNIEFFEWIYNKLKNGEYTESPNITLDTYKRLNTDFKEEIKNYEILFSMKKELKKTNKDLYRTIKKHIQLIEQPKKNK